jgi:6-phosphogluconolactonase (cycloisomerase 2 family)
VTPDGRFVYVSNAGSGSVSGFAIGSGGTLTPLPGTILALNPTGSSNIDITVSADGKFLYTLNAVLSPIWGLPAIFRQRPGLNGIAAN